MSGQRENFVLLTDIPEPVLVGENGAEPAGDLGGAVRAAGIEHDDFVGEIGATCQAAREILLLVKGDQAEGDVHGEPGGGGILVNRISPQRWTATPPMMQNCQDRDSQNRCPPRAAS